VTAPDPFELGLKSFLDYNITKTLSYKQFNPYNPASHLDDYDDFEAGYEYGFYLSKLPEQGTSTKEQTTK
jgi:hypothetical protein